MHQIPRLTFSDVEYMFSDVEYMFSDVEYMFSDVEYMFFYLRVIILAVVSVFPIRDSPFFNLIS